jgi:hypothetical protein
MFAVLAAIAFAIGAVFQAVNGPDLDHNWPFWFLLGLVFWVLEGVALPALPRRRERG